MSTAWRSGTWLRRRRPTFSSSRSGRSLVSGDAAPEDTLLLGHLLQTAAAVAKKLGVADDGFRVVINNGAGAGQTVFHLHVHVLAGRNLGWPPG
jgi:hypothetical protein